MALLEKTRLRELTPARLWAELDQATRELAARTVYGDALDDDSSRLEADAAIATTLRFRPLAVRKLPVEKRVGYLLRAVRADDALASTLLLALHFGQRRELLAAFLDRLGVAHEDGVIQADAFEVPEPERLADAVDALYGSFPGEHVDVYLATLVAMEPESWEGLIELLERRR